MPLSDRDYMKGKHPPSCTCVDCVNERLGIRPRGEKSFSFIRKNDSVRSNKNKRETIHCNQNENTQVNNTANRSGGGIYGGNESKKVYKNPIPKWLVALLIIFALSVTGWGLSIYIGVYIPFWILFGFSLILTVEKWLYYPLKKNKLVGKLYKLVLNLSILSLLGLIIWTGVRLFSNQFTSNVIVGSIIFIAELIFFIWLWKIVGKNSWRWPSMKFTIFSLTILLLIFAFAGVQPLTFYKDKIFTSISSFFNSSTQNPAEDQKQYATPTEVFSKTAGPTPKPVLKTTTPTPTIKKTGIDESNGEYKNYYLGLVKTPEGVDSGECYGEFIVLINSRNAENPTYSELLDFLKSDKTDEFPYQNSLSVIGFYYGEPEDRIDLDRVKNIIDGIEQPKDPKVCADFAERLHNNAESAGIRCGYVVVDNLNHALDVFETTDRGLVYIDDTGTFLFGPSNCDKVVDVKKGEEYIPKNLFPEYGWSDTWNSMGIVDDIFITWDGEWR